MRFGLHGYPGCHPFFRNELGGGSRLGQEIFYLAYHLHWPCSEIMGLAINERKAFVAMLVERIEADNQAFEEMRERLRQS